MKLIFIDNLRPGMVAAQDIFLPENPSSPLVRANTVFTNVMIDNLIRLDVRFVHIKDKPDRPPHDTNQSPPASLLHVPKPAPIIAPRLREEAVGSLQSLFSAATIAAEDLHESSATIIKHLDTVVSQLVDSLQREKGALVNITDLKSYDEYTYHHSLSVAVLSIAIAQYMGFGDDILHRLGMSAIMHDIGKTAVPIEIIHKTSRLDDDEFKLVKTHSPAGFDYLVKTSVVDEEILRGVLCHHEKVDGTGYPNGLKDQEIPLWSRIISVADVYDALTSNRPYRTPMQPTEAIEYIMGGVGSSFDYDVVSAFVKKVELYPVGRRILLSNGMTAVVLNNENQMRPLVRDIGSGRILDLYRDLKCLSIVVNQLLPEDSPG